MDALWQKLTLSQLPLGEWRGASLLYQLVGLVHRWQYGSLLLRFSDAISIWLLALFFGLAPFVSTKLMSVLLIGCAAFWLLLTLADGADKARDRPGLTPIHLVVMLYWGISVVATGLSPVKTAALEGLSKLTLYLLLFVFMARVLRSPKLRNWLISIYLHVSLVVSAFGIYQERIGVRPLATWSDPESDAGKVTRVYSYLGNPNLLAGYLIPAIIFSVMAIFAWKRPLAKILAAIMALANTMCLIYTYSRGGWIALVIATLGIALILGYWFNLYRSKWILPGLIGGFLGVSLLAVIAIPSIRARALSIFTGRGDSSNNFRINVWASVVQMIKARPILGIGPGNDAFNKIYPAFSRSKFTALGAYSVPLEILVETGFVGFGCFIWLLIVSFNQASRCLIYLQSQADRQGYWLMGAIVTMVAMMAHGFVDTVWYRPQVNSLWWMAVAIVAGYAATVPTNNADGNEVYDREIQRF
jgi:putative inorganic carbon (hco3(-)) transporter